MKLEKSVETTLIDVLKKKYLQIPEETREKYLFWVEDIGNIKKLISKISLYFYEALSPSQIQDKAESEDNEFMDGVLHLSRDCFFAENPPNLTNLKMPSYLVLPSHFRQPLIHEPDLTNLFFPKVSGTIMLKPNFVSTEPFPVTTSLDTLEKIVIALKSRNPLNRIIVADGPSLFFSSVQVFRQPDLLSLAKRYELELFDLNRSNYGYLKIGGRTIAIPRLLCDVTYLVNVSNFKEHNQAGTSSAVKNHLGLIAPFQRLRLHKSLNFMADIKEVCYSLSGSYHIVDCRSILRGAQQIRYGGYSEKGDGFILGGNLSEVESFACRRFMKNENL